MKDELGLLGRYGLEYLQPDPFAHVTFPDGEHLTAWLDRERTVEEIARFSRPDAAAYGRMLDEYDDVKHIFSAAQFNPVGFGPSLEQRLAEHPRGTIWLRRRAMSAWDVIRHEFEDEHIQAFLLWQAYQTLVPVESDGSGQLAYSLVFGRQRRSWTLPRGGSGALTDALVRCIEEHGGSVICDQRVTRLLLSGGPLRGRRDRGRLALHGERGGRLDDPRQAPAGDGARRRLGRGLPLRRRNVRRRRLRHGRLSWPRPRRRCSRRRTAAQRRVRRAGRVPAAR